MNFVLPAFLALFLLFSCDFENDNENTPFDYPEVHLLLSAEDLSEIRRQSNVVIVDMRPYDEFEAGSIPGAISFGGVEALHQKDYPVGAMLIGPREFQDLMQNHGISRDHTIVAYDGGQSLFAARLFYALEVYGHEDVRILNGGFAAWEEAGFETVEPLRYGSITYQESTFEIEVQEERMCDVAYIMEMLERDDVVIFDARSEDEYTGADARSEQTGHIPGAVNLVWSENIESEGVPFFKPANVIKAQLEERGITPDKQVIPHCHTNVRGSHAYFTLRLMGYADVRAYEGSWGEWGNRSDVPVSN